ncbi:hypothetical protein C8R44DRAFT_883713 [Mycena epipterygia]|nr:hypothetical protein C8R44DRAFT_883713 [Mycena epipterygia]
MAAFSDTQVDAAASGSSSTACGPGISEPKFPDGWDELVHPNGSIYYYNPRLRIVTLENVYNALVLGRLLNMHEEHSNWLADATPRYPDDVETLIYRESGEQDDILHIKIASWHRSLIYDYSAKHQRYVPGYQYDFWQYISRYPMHRTYLPHYMEVDFVRALAFGANERVLEAKTTPFPFEDTQIMRLMQVYIDLKESQIPLIPAMAYHIATAMYEIEKARQRYGYATKNNRLYRDMAIKEVHWKVDVSDIIISVLLCGTHRNYRTRLACTVPNGKVSLPDFRRLMQSLMAEWADSNLVATVFVSVDVGFLAVPGITALQRACVLASSLCAMTSIVTGLYHVWQHRQKTDVEIEDATRYIHSLPLWCLRKPQTRSDSQVTLTVTACLLALPLASLQWSVLSFTIAIAAFAFESTLRARGHAIAIFIALFTLLTIVSCAAFVFFSHVWRPPLHREMEEGLDPNVVDIFPPMFHERLRARFDTVLKSVRDFVGFCANLVGLQIWESGTEASGTEASSIEASSTEVSDSDDADSSSSGD